MSNRVRVLAMLGSKQAHTAAPLLRTLDARRFRVDIGDLPPGEAGVILAWTDDPLRPAEASLVHDFVRRGGGLVLLHGTLAAWSSADAIRELAGWGPSGPGPLTELVVRPDPDHQVTQRLDPEWNVTDELYLSEGPPLDANVLLRAIWRFSEQVVAYERHYGNGRFVYVGLGR